MQVARYAAARKEPGGVAVAGGRKGGREGGRDTRSLTREWSRKGREEENAELIGGLSLHATLSAVTTTRRDGVAYGHIDLLQTSLTLLLILSCLRKSCQLML